MLADSELDLLIEFKLDGNTGEELAALNGSSSNAVRQRFKRLLAKLRTYLRCATHPLLAGHLRRRVPQSCQDR